MDIYTNKKIGIWGYGLIGRSAVHYFSQFNCQISVMDNKESVNAELQMLSFPVTFYKQQDRDTFFLMNDFIFSSSGIDILIPYATHKHKWLFELDLFYDAWQKPIVAITGTIGKTSTTTFLSHILTKHGLKVATGGNIGVACFDLLPGQNKYDLAVLEVSSFQLQHCKRFAPTLAIWTNFFPNHLDRHADEQEYFDAKYSMLKNGTIDQKTVLPIDLYPSILSKGYSLDRTVFFSAACPSTQLISALPNNIFFYIHNHTIMMQHNNVRTPIITVDALPPVTLPINWVLLCATLFQMNIPPQKIETLAQHTQPVEHRIEKVATINGVDFYNDSKSTTVQATLAAVQKIHDRPIHLFLGGLSKGVDRTFLIEQLVDKVSYIYCFGKEALFLYDMCIRFGIRSHACATLDEAFNMCLKLIQCGDQVLLSPSGSSYDLFKNYEERGIYFKNLVKRVETSMV